MKPNALGEKKMVAREREKKGGKRGKQCREREREEGNGGGIVNTPPCGFKL